MDEKDNHDKKFEKEEKEMSALLEKKRINLKEKLARISAKASPLKTKNGMIELDPNNPQHKEWFEIDKYKGK